MDQLLPGSVRVVVIEEDGVVLNDPEHHSLGRIPVGQTAVTHEAYVPHLREHHLAVPVDELGELDIADIKAQFAAIGLDDDEAGNEQEEEEVKEKGASVLVPEMQTKTKGRPRTAAK